MSAGPKAGLVGAAVAVLLSLLLPTTRVVWIAVAPSVVLYLAVGILAAYWAKSPRNVGQGAGAGAVAGLVTGLACGLIPIIFTVVGFIAGATRAPLVRYYQHVLRDMRAAWQVGAVPGMVRIGAVALRFGSAMVIAVALGAAGGAILSSLQRKSPAPTAGPEPGD